jgi:HK97 family phage major capsid protein
MTVEEVLKALKELREQCGHLPEFRSQLDAVQKSLAERDADAKKLRSDLDTIKAAFEAREKEIKDLQQRQRVQMVETDPVRCRRRALEIFGMQCRAALARFLGVKLGERYAGEAEAIKQYHEQRAQRATLELQAGSATVLVPTILEEGMMIETMEEIQSTVLQADFLTGMPTHATIPTITGRPSLQPQRASSDSDMTQSDATFGQIEYVTKEGYIFFPVDNWLLELSPIAIGSMLLPLIRDSMIDGLNNWFWNADGTASFNSFTGVLKNGTAAYIYNLPAAKKNFSDITGQDLWKMKSQALARGRARGSYFLSDDLFGALMEESREGKEPFVTFTPDGTSRIWGKPVVIDEMLPDLAASAAETPFAAFGDLKTMLVAVAGAGIRLDVSREVLFKRNQTAFRGLIHKAIVRKPVKTLIVAKTAA